MRFGQDFSGKSKRYSATQAETVERSSQDVEELLFARPLEFRNRELSSVEAHAVWCAPGTGTGVQVIHK